jgi:glycosyltransferase involved in cell wall biosynthesis
MDSGTIIMQFCFLTRSRTLHTHDVALLNGFRKLGIPVLICRDLTRGFQNYLNLYRQLKKLEYDVVLVEFYGRALTVIARLATRKPIVYNAVNAFTDAIVTSRGHSRFGWRALLAWLGDFIEFRCADYVLVETDAQALYCSRLFLLPRKRFIRTWTGVDETTFFRDPAIAQLTRFTVLFRGAFLPESGIMVLAETVHLLQNEDIGFRIIGNGMLASKFAHHLEGHVLPNVEWIRDRLSDEDLRTKMLECHLSLGQLADNPRLQRTIPHKAYESLALGLPYLTARAPGILELLIEGDTCVCFRPGNAKNLAAAIVRLRDDTRLRQAIADHGYSFFQHRLESQIIAKKLLSDIEARSC